MQKENKTKEKINEMENTSETNTKVEKLIHVNVLTFRSVPSFSNNVSRGYLTTKVSLDCFLWKHIRRIESIKFVYVFLKESLICVELIFHILGMGHC